jgi:hypothetical protein
MLGGILGAHLNQRPKVSIDMAIEGDDGGRPDAGSGQAPGGQPVEAVGQNSGPAEPNRNPASVEPLMPVQALLPPLVGRERERLVDQDPTKSLDKLRQSVAVRLRDAHPREGNNGSPGIPGRLGGKLTIHQQRLLRWVMVFNIRQPEDYARQLQDLKAILAIPISGKDKEFLVIDDLSKRPAKPKARDVTQIDRIYWRDDRPESVSSLARVLGIVPAPPYFIAFFPAELEKKLLDRELAYAGGKPEGMIDETRFEIRSTAKGYEPFVVDQRYR